MPVFYFNPNPIRSRHPVLRRATIAGKPGIAHWQENSADGSGWYDCSIDGERTVSGQRRHDLWRPEQVTLGAKLR